MGSNQLHVNTDDDLLERDLDVAIKQDQAWNGRVSCMTRRMPCQGSQDDDKLAISGTELSAQCKHSVIHSPMHMPPFEQATKVMPQLCSAKASGQLLADGSPAWLQPGEASGTRSNTSLHPFVPRPL